MPIFVDTMAHRQDSQRTDHSDQSHADLQCLDYNCPIPLAQKLGTSPQFFVIPLFLVPCFILSDYPPQSPNPPYKPITAPLHYLANQVLRYPLGLITSQFATLVDTLFAKPPEHPITHELSSARRLPVVMAHRVSTAQPFAIYGSVVAYPTLPMTTSPA